MERSIGDVISGLYVVLAAASALQLLQRKRHWHLTQSTLRKQKMCHPNWYSTSGPSRSTLPI